MDIIEKLNSISYHEAEIISYKKDNNNIYIENKYSRNPFGLRLWVK